MIDLDVIFPRPMTFGEGDIKIACVGDSITYGMCIDDRAHHSYPAVLSRFLGSSYSIKNFGVSNRCATRQYPFGYFLTGFEWKIKKYRPDIALIMFGSNDSKLLIWNKDRFREDYIKLINKIKKKNARIFILLPIPAYNDDEPPGKYRINNELIAADIRDVLIGVAKEHGAKIIDLYTPLIDRRELYADGIHPNEAGAAVIAEVIYNKIREVKNDF